MKTPLPELPQQRVLVDWVVATIREAIVRGCFDPGERLDQDLIGSQLRTSRTPVREALGRLEVEGFVEVRPHRGAFVVMPSEQDIKETYDVLCILETEIIRRVTCVIPESLLCDLETRLAEDQKKIDRGELSSYFEIDSPRFPSSLVELLDNGLLRDMMVSLNNRIEVIHRVMQRRLDLVAESHVEHQAILAAMQARDAEKAGELTKRHLENSANRLLTLRQ